MMKKKKYSRKNLCKKIEKTREEIEKKKEDLVMIKNLVLKQNLDTDYLKKKTMILNNIYFLREKLSVVYKLQDILKSSASKLLPVNLSEWSAMLERLEKLSVELDVEYHESLASLSDGNCQLSDIESKIEFPENDIALLLQDAFDKFSRSVICDQKYTRLPLMQQQKELERSVKELAQQEGQNKSNPDDWRKRNESKEEFFGKEEPGVQLGLHVSSIGPQRLNRFNDSSDRLLSKKSNQESHAQK